MNGIKQKNYYEKQTKKVKEQLYCPDKQGTFRMMFGFQKPSMYANKRQDSGIKEVYYTKISR